MSPEVLPDRKITFRIQAPTASEVQLVVFTEYADLHTYPVPQDEGGVWSTTIGPVDPAIYPHCFKIGGASVNRGNVEVHGSTPAVYDPRNVPHGSTNTHAHFSKVQNRLRELSVSVPPQYYSEPQRAFPVVNWGDSQNGRGDVIDATILDNLDVEKKAFPMIMVLVNTSVSANIGNSPKRRV